ncbi:MAG: hypothetical protein U1D30_06425 [Planctomycetota bacterium]
MKKIAFVTYAGLKRLSEDDRLAIPALQARGVEVEATVWNDPLVEWSRYAAIVLRSTWDYSDHFEEFSNWLDCMEAARVPLWNPVGVVRSNLRKDYLKDLSAGGIAIPETVWLGDRWPSDLTATLWHLGWKQAVAKPRIGHSAKGVFLVREDGSLRTPDGRAMTGPLPPAKDYFLQEYLAEIGSSGEWSLVFLEGEFSHAVLKRPHVRDFRVQEEHGGSQEAAVPPQWLLDQACVVDLIPNPWLYARVDGVIRDGQFMVMELELVEPALFFKYDAGAPMRFADAVLQRI